MALLGKSKFLGNLFNQGMVADIVKGVGLGTLVNVLDKKALGGKLTTTGFSIGQTLNAKPLTINATDAITALATTGITTSGKGMMTMLVTVGAKKVFEAFDYIDPPTIGNSGSATNVTERRIREQLKVEMSQIAQQQRTHSVQQTSTLGGLN